MFSPPRQSSHCSFFQFQVSVTELMRRRAAMRLHMTHADEGSDVFQDKLTEERLRYFLAGEVVNECTQTMTLEETGAKLKGESRRRMFVLVDKTLEQVVDRRKVYVCLHKNDVADVQFI